MTRVPAEIATEFASAVAAEQEARGALRDALRRQSALVRQLREAGVRLTDAVIPVARALGEAATPSFRHRLATRLRKRAEREDRRQDRCPRDLPGVSPRHDSALLPMVERKEATVANEKRTLVRRTITTEVYASPDVDPEIESDEEIEDEEPEDDEDEPSRKKRR